MVHGKGVAGIVRGEHPAHSLRTEVPQQHIHHLFRAPSVGDQTSQSQCVVQVVLLHMTPNIVHDVLFDGPRGGDHLPFACWAHLEKE